MEEEIKIVEGEKNKKKRLHPDKSGRSRRTSATHTGAVKTQL
jgi:hypothetical protein